MNSSELGPLPAPYHALFARARAVFEGDARVLALWLSGSLARGDADAQSDLDLLVATTDEGHASFGDDWQKWLESITPTVLAKRIPGIAGLYAVTPEWLRLDVVWEPRGVLPRTFFRTRRLVFDRGDCAAVIPAEQPRPGPSAQVVSDLVAESLRITGLMPVAVGRADWLLGLEGIWLQRMLLFQLFQQANAPLPQTGLKQWSAKLKPAQREILAALPTGSASRQGVIAGSVAAAQAFLAAARPIAESLGVTWPDGLERATREHLRTSLGVELPKS